MPAFSDPALRSGAAKSKEEAEGEQACAAARNSAGSPAGASEAASQHGVCIDPREHVAQVGGRCLGTEGWTPISL